MSEQPFLWGALLTSNEEGERKAFLNKTCSAQQLLAHRGQTDCSLAVEENPTGKDIE